MPTGKTPWACHPASAPAAEAAPDSSWARAAPAWCKPFPPLAHWDLLEILGLTHTLGRSPGRGFLIWRGRGARLVRALVEFMLDLHTREFGYEEVRVPVIAAREALTGSAHLPTLEDKMYAVEPGAPGGMPASEPAAPGGMPTPPLRGHVAETESSMPTGKMPWACHPARFLAPRGEPYLANLYAGVTMAGAQLPERFVAAGRAFRREAGGRGAQGRGLLRLHEFDTVELYAFCRPDQDEEELAHAVRAAEAVLERLEVPHRRTLRAARDLSHAAAKTWDLEVGAPGMKEWLSVAALSTFTDYQARRTNTRYSEPGPSARPRLVHTVGGAAVALPRLLAALLENHQQSDGSVRLPPALAPYMGGEGALAVSAKP